MKFVVVFQVDLVHSPLGFASRLTDDLAGRTVLRQTVERVARAQRPASLHVQTPADHAERVAALLAGTPARIEAGAWPRPAYRELIAAARRWAPDAWRGGIGGLCWWDEECDVAACAEIARRANADGVAIVPAAAPLFDPNLLDAMIAHYDANAEVVRLVFSQAPPGLGPVLMARSLLEEMAPGGQPPGAVLAYRPDHPQPDLTGKNTCYRPAASIIEARGRLIADTRRSFARVADLIAEGADAWPAERIGAWLCAAEDADPGDPPEEIELELTTEDPQADRTRLRPRGAIVPRRGPLALNVVRRVADSLREWDDVRIVLGGFGEPLLHPQFEEIVRTLRNGGAAAVTVRTSGLVEPAAFNDALFTLPLDAIIVTLDAATRDTYRDVHGIDAFDAVMRRIEQWMERRVRERRVRPLIVPEFVKTTANFADLEAFYDQWMARLGTAVIAGPSHYARQCDDLRVTDVTPPRRVACRRLFRRALLLADGTLAACDQDFAARQPIGRIDDQPLLDAWRGAAFKRLRDTHRRAAKNPAAALPLLEPWPLCARCDEWHRP